MLQLKLASAVHNIKNMAVTVNMVHQQGQASLQKKNTHSSAQGPVMRRPVAKDQQTTCQQKTEAVWHQPYEAHIVQ